MQAGRASLRVKIKSLADEARTIRHEEKRYKGDSSERGLLRWHRITVVRDESRAAQVAYAFLRGRRYRDIESKSSKPLAVERVAAIAKKFGYASRDELNEWLNE